VQKLARLYEKGGRFMIILGLQLVSELRKELIEKREVYYSSNQEKGNYNEKNLKRRSSVVVCIRLKKGTLTKRENGKRS